MMFTIIGPTSKKILRVTWLEINTPVGNFVIQAGHAPTVLTLTGQQPITFCLKNGKQESLLIHEGVVEITRESATLFVNQEL